MPGAMNRCAATLSVAFILWATTVRAGPAEVLLDPHAGSADKYDAVKKLSEAGPAAIDAAAALARQSKYDQPHIRELALQTLVRLVGEKEAERLRNQVDQDDRRVGDDVAQRWLDSAKTWDQLPRAALFFHNARPEFQRAAAIAAIRIWENTHTLPPKEIGFDDEARRDYVAVLSKLMPVLSDAGVRSAAELTLALRMPEPEATPGPEAVPTLLTALAAEDPKTRDLARKAADKIFKPDSGDRQKSARVIAGIV